MKSQLYLWSRQVLYLGRSFDSTMHTHHAVQLTIGLDGPLRINKGFDDDQQLPAVVISSEVSHSLEAQGQWVASIYLEPESDDYEHLINYYRGDAESRFKLPSIELGVPEQFLELLQTGVDPDLAQRLLRKIITPQAMIDSQPVDHRVIRVLKYLNNEPGLNVPVAKLAEYVSLSPDRLSHLFKQEIGIPIRRFILWQKLRVATGVACQGKPLTYAAQEGGFTDSAHFTHSFQKLFGINPSFLFGQQHQLAVYIE